MKAITSRLKSGNASPGPLRMPILLLMLQLHVWHASGSHHPALWENPYAHPAFDNNTNRDQTITVGQTANLACTVRNLGDRAVSWIRKHDLHIITIGIMTYTNDQRFQAIHAEGSDEWTLRITSGQPRDSAIYECQVSTEPKISLAFRLTVVVAKARIQANSEMFYKSGSDINLTCTSEMVSHAPSFIYWYKDGYLINYSQRGGINVLTEQQTARSTLLISRAAPPDSGNYTCFPSNTNSASVLVHVIKTEHRAAMQHENNAATRLRMANRHALCLAMALLVVVLMPLFWMPPPPSSRRPTLRPPSTSSSSSSETVAGMVAALFSLLVTTSTGTSPGTSTCVSSLAQPMVVVTVALTAPMLMNHPEQQLRSNRQQTTLTSLAAVVGVTGLLLMVTGSWGQWPGPTVAVSVMAVLLVLVPLVVLMASGGAAGAAEVVLAALTRGTGTAATAANIVQLAENEDDDRRSDVDDVDDGDNGRDDLSVRLPGAERLLLSIVRPSCGHCSPHNWTGRTAIAEAAKAEAEMVVVASVLVVSCHSWWLPEMLPPVGSSTLASSSLSSLWKTRSPRMATTWTTWTWTWKNSRRWSERRRSLTTLADHRSSSNSSIVILGGGCCLRLWSGR